MRNEGQALAKATLCFLLAGAGANSSSPQGGDVFLAASISGDAQPAIRGNAAMVRLLIAYGASWQERNGYGGTAVGSCPGANMPTCWRSCWPRGRRRLPTRRACPMSCRTWWTRRWAAGRAEWVWDPPVSVAHCAITWRWRQAALRHLNESFQGQASCCGARLAQRCLAVHIASNPRQRCGVGRATHES